jgi:hypothetical protein
LLDIVDIYLLSRSVGPIATPLEMDCSPKISYKAKQNVTILRAKHGHQRAYNDVEHFSREPLLTSMTATTRNNLRAPAFPLIAAVGLTLLALHSALGSGPAGAAAGLFNRQALESVLAQSWPDLCFAVGLMGSRRWARDLGAPAAGLALLRVLAAFPRYAFLAWGASIVVSGPAHSAWPLFRHAMGDLAAYTALCAMTLYVLVQPELRRACLAERAQPTWTDGLSFAALWLVSYQIFATNSAVIRALYLLRDHSGSAAYDPWVIGLCALALLTLLGLWTRRAWGWMALLLQNCILLYQALQLDFNKAQLALDSLPAKLQAAALPYALEALCRGLPELIVIAAVFGGILKARREFQR